jgi:succinyl-CoA synthetase beta subunit
MRTTNQQTEYSNGLLDEAEKERKKERYIDAVCDRKSGPRSGSASREIEIEIEVLRDSPENQELPSVSCD